MITLLDVLRLHAWLHPRREVLVTEDERLTSRQFYQQSKKLARLLQSQYGLCSGKVVFLLCRNHLISVLLLPALMRLGVRIRLINTDMAALQVNALVQD